MLGDFRYLVVCESASRELENDRLTLRGIIDVVSVEQGDSCDLCWQFSAFIESSMKGKCIEFWLGRSSPSSGLGKLIHRIKLPAPEKGSLSPWIYGQRFACNPKRSDLMAIQAIDADGALGPPGAVLSTFKFWVNVVAPARRSPARPPHGQGRHQ